MAVDLAKLSLWLATLAKDHAFTFLDHNFRHGDSLVGLSLAQIEACHWSPDVQQAFVSASPSPPGDRGDEEAAGDPDGRRVHQLRKAQRPAGRSRHSRSSSSGSWAMRFSASSSKAARPRPGSDAANDLSHTIRDYLNDDDRHAHPACPAGRHRAVGLRFSHGLEPSLPAVSLGDRIPRGFLETTPDGSIRRAGRRRIRCRWSATRRSWAVEHDGRRDFGRHTSTG